MTFAFFIGVQELNDTSQLAAVIMRTQYDFITIAKAVVIAHSLSNFLCVLFFWPAASLVLSGKEQNMLSCAVIYFIITYEILFAILKEIAEYA